MGMYGNNLLNIALGILGTTPIQYYRFKTRAMDANRNYYNTYEDAGLYQASVQPVSVNKYAFEGLDLNKIYIDVWLEANASPIGRDRSNDRIECLNTLWDVCGKTDWYGQDGWVKIRCVQVKEETPS